MTEPTPIEKAYAITVQLRGVLFELSANDERSAQQIRDRLVELACLGKGYLKDEARMLENVSARIGSVQAELGRIDEKNSGGTTSAQKCVIRCAMHTRPMTLTSWRSGSARRRRPSAGSISGA